jgi:hypothetical protein
MLKMMGSNVMRLRRLKREILYLKEYDERIIK